MALLARLVLHFAVLIQYRRVTDGRTDRQTHDDSIYRASIASCGKNDFRSFDRSLHIRLIMRTTVEATVQWKSLHGHVIGVVQVRNTTSSYLSSLLRMRRQ